MTQPVKLTSLNNKKFPKFINPFDFHEVFDGVEPYSLAELSMMKVKPSRISLIGMKKLKMRKSLINGEPSLVVRMRLSTNLIYNMYLTNSFITAIFHLDNYLQLQSMECGCLIILLMKPYVSVSLIS